MAVVLGAKNGRMGFFQCRCMISNQGTQVWNQTVARSFAEKKSEFAQI